MRYPPHLFEDCIPGKHFESGPRRVTREDIAAFAQLSGDHTALHSDDAYAAATPFGGVVAHGALNLAAATGLAWSAGLFEGTVLAVAAMTVRFDRPVLPGDELMLQLTVREQEPRPRPERGRVVFDVKLVNQHGRTVLSGDWTLVLRRSPAAPAPPH